MTLHNNTVENNIASTADWGVGGGSSIGGVIYTRTLATLTDNVVRGNLATTAITNTSTSGNTFAGNIGSIAQAGYYGGGSIPYWRPGVCHLHW